MPETSRVTLKRKKLMGHHTRATDRSLAEMAAQVGDRLRAAGQTLVTAESCTGGWIAKAVTDVAGSSAWFLGAFVTYSDAMKLRHLAVAAGSLQSDGAVSEAVVRQMAAGARKAGGSDWALAGPALSTTPSPATQMYIVRLCGLRIG